MSFANIIAIDTIRNFLLTLGLSGFGMYLYLEHIYEEDLRVRQAEIVGLGAEIDYLANSLEKLPSGLTKTRSERLLELDRLSAQEARKKAERQAHLDDEPWFKGWGAFGLFAFAGLCISVAIFGMAYDEYKADRDKKREAKIPRKHNRPTRKRSKKFSFTIG